MERRRRKSFITHNVGKIKRALAVLMAILMIVSVIDYNGMQYASAADGDMVNIIKGFSALSEEVANQLLTVGALESEINKPVSLTVSSELYMIDTAHAATGSAIAVTGSAISSNSEYTLTGITWELDAEHSISPSFSSEMAGNYYTYKAVLPATDGGNAVQLAEGVSLPQISVQIVDEDISGVISFGGVTVDKLGWYAMTDTSGTVTTEGASSANYNIHAVLGDVNGTPTAIVTLRDATISNSLSKHAIEAEGWDLDIVLEGTSNQIGVGSTNEYGNAIYSSTGNKVTIAGEGDLTLKGTYGININGLGEVNINTTGNLNIASEWQLVMTSGNIIIAAKGIEATGYYFYGAYVSLTALDGDIHSSCSGQYAIQASGDITIAAPKGEISMTGTNYAIKAVDYIINVSALNDVTLNGTVQGKEISITSETGNLTINGYYKAIESAQTSVNLYAPSGDIILNAKNSSDIISGSNNFALAITAGGKLEAKGPYGIQVYGSANIKADRVSVTNTAFGYTFNGGALNITNPSGGNCSEVYISGGDGNRDAINAYRDVNIKADKVMIITGSSAEHAINASSIMGDVSVTIGDAGVIVGMINISGTNAISEDILLAEKRGVVASYGLNLNTTTPSQSTYYKAGDGYVIFTPGAGDTPATLLLNNATIHNGIPLVDNALGMENEGIALPAGDLIIRVEGGNYITSSYGDAMGYLGSRVTMAGSGVLNVDGIAGDIMLDDGSFSFAEGTDVTLNGVVTVRNYDTSQSTETVYGNLTIGTAFRSLYGDAVIASDATVTIPGGEKFWLDETDSITINGQIINNGTIVLPYNYTPQQIEALNLTGNIQLIDRTEDKYRIYIDGSIYAYGGNMGYNFSMVSVPTEVTYYESINGYSIFIPASYDTQANLTLHNVNLFGCFTLPDIPLTIVLEGENEIDEINVSDSIVIEGNGKLTVYYFENSSTGATLTVNSGATLNTMYSYMADGITTNTIYGSFTISEDARFYVGASNKLVLSAGAVFTLREDGNMEFHSDATLADMTLGAGASIVNNTYITLPQGTTEEQIKALPLSGAGMVRVTTAYDSHGYPDTWDTYTNEGLPITAVEGDYLELTETEVPASENKGYTWHKSGEGDNEVWTLTLNNTFINCRLYLPNKVIVISSMADSIIKDICTEDDYALNITFSGTAPLRIGDMIYGVMEGDTVKVQAGAKVTVDGGISIGGYGGKEGTLYVTGTGTTLTVSSPRGDAVICDRVYVQDGATMTVKEDSEDSIGIRAISDVSITGGSTLKADNDYGVYVTGEQGGRFDIVGKLTVDESSKLITNCSVAPFCIVDITSSKIESEVLSLAGIPSGTEIASVRGGQDGEGYTYWSLVPADGSLTVTNEINSQPVTLMGAVSGELSFVKAVIPDENPGDTPGEDPGENHGGDDSGDSSFTDTTQPNAGNQADWEAAKENIKQTLEMIKQSKEKNAAEENTEENTEGDTEEATEEEKNTITIEMNESSVVPKEILESIIGMDVTLIFDIGNGVTWSVNGQSITDNSLEDIDLSVTMEMNTVPEELIDGVAGEQAFKTISLSHDGKLGFEAVLTINMDKKNKWLYANLFYYNPETKQLELQGSGRIDKNGYVEFTFAHASDYVITIGTESVLENAMDQIAISETKGKLYVGGTQKKWMRLTLEIPNRIKEVADNGSSELEITYQSSNPKVAKVTASGKITAKKAGKTTITTLVTINGVQRKFQTKITVSKAYIKLINSTNTLKTGSTFTYKAVGYGVKTEDIKFYTSEKSIVVINKATGKAKARTKGTDYVIAKAGKVKAKIKVKVS